MELSDATPTRLTEIAGCRRRRLTHYLNTLKWHVIAAHALALSQWRKHRKMPAVDNNVARVLHRSNSVRPSVRPSVRHARHRCHIVGLSSRNFVPDNRQISEPSIYPSSRYMLLLFPNDAGGLQSKMTYFASSVTRSFGTI